MAGAQPGSSSNQYVVVWEWYHDSFGWRPYSPYVSQSLERAHSKKLKKLFLGDTEPSLSNYFVLFDRMEQICSKSDKAHQVRRIFYPQTSPAGCGRVWEWCDNAGWKSYNMEVQYVIDDAYHNTASSQLDLSKCFPQLPYIIDFEKDKQIRKESKYERKIRCANIASYPMTKPTDQDVIITLADIKSSKTKRFMGKITSLVKSISVPNSPKKGNQSNTAQSRQPLPGPQDLSQVPGPSGRRVRRPSSDTISTYLSKDSSGVDSNENLVDLDTAKDQTMSTRSAQNKRLAAPDTKNDILRTSSYVVEPPDADCAICYCPLAEKGGYTRQKDCPVELSQCGHVFHLCCLEQMAHDQINQTGIRCPSCKELYGVYSGNMPHGSMKHYVRSYSLPGYDGYKTIEIQYNFKAGTQGPEHPHPGRPYYATGFPRTAYLPDSPEGQTALKLLQTAFERRLTFTVGRSTTTGRDDVITWNEIHHKTSKDNRNGHGYPDPNYLPNLFQELASFGIM